MHRILIVFILSIFLLSFPKRLDCEEVKALAISSLSPVYEEMLGNQIVLLRDELIKKKVAKRGDVFFIAGLGKEKQTLASGVARSLRRTHRTAGNWQFAHVNDWKGEHKNIPFRGVILVEADRFEDFESSVLFLNAHRNAGFLMAFINPSTDRKWLESISEKNGLKVQAEVTPSELEFVKDESGRQIVDLDLPIYRNQIYERLVREGMNPVNAHPAADEAIQNFRASQDLKIFIIGKN